MEDGCLDSNDGDQRYGPSVITDSDWIPKFFERNYRTTQLLFTRRNGRTVTNLKKPRDLYALKSTVKAGPKWPIESQVLLDRPHHILYTPPRLESLYKKEKEIYPPHKTADIFGKVVYDNSPDPEIKYFISSKTNSKLPKLQPYYTLKDETDKTLVFESRFESGNLMRAVKVREHDYQLWLQFDLYTKKHTQWYYFQIKNTCPNVTYRFTIMNFLKSGSLYNEGMKPLLYSEEDARKQNIGWVHAGSDIKYYKNDIKVEENKDRCYYSLHWTCTFPNESDTYYFAHSYPYTYSDLQEYLTYLNTDQHRRKVCKQRVLCQTLAGNSVYVLTITAPTRCPKQAKLKKAMVISSRIHPGETVASWMMKGLLDYLTSNEPDAVILRETFIFKIIPMLNPDGVIVGNYRCSLSGRDLNRNYKTVLKDSLPPVWSTRYLIKRLQEEREVVLYCDFHGHSRKKNIFIYGCENKTEKFKRYYSRVFPLIMNKNIPDLFSYNACRFRIQKSKEGTGRVVMWNLGIRYSYTLEASFCGSSYSKGYHFGVQDYEAMGYHFCDSLLDMFDPDTTKFNNLVNEIQERLQAAMLKKMLEDGQIDVSDVSVEQIEYMTEIESDSIGSDSSVSDGLPMQLLHASIPEISKKKRLKTRKERNKNLKKESKAPIRKAAKSSPPESSRERSPEKQEEKKRKKKILPIRMSYTNRCEKQSQAMSVTPTCDDRTNDLFDQFTYSYIQAGLINDSLVDISPSVRFSRHSPCERCNPAYHLSNDILDRELEKYKNNGENYSLHEVHMPANSLSEINPTLELARRITTYNYRTGKVPPRLGKKFSVWATEHHRGDYILKRRTLNQGDNVDYFRQKLENVTSKEKFACTVDRCDTFDKFPTRSPSPRKATAVDFSSSRPYQNMKVSPPPRVKSLKLPDSKKDLPKIQKKKSRASLESLYIDPHSNTNSFDQNSNIFLTPHKRFSSLTPPDYTTIPRSFIANVKKRIGETPKDRLVLLGGSGTLQGVRDVEPIENIL